jgi:replication initiation protein RepC
MEHVMSSPVQRHVRRTKPSYHDDRRTVAPVKKEDARWSLLDLVRRCRKPLGLRDRDVAVLRGLLSFVPQSADPSTLVVFASNSALIERCDGIDERTLRRRLAHLKANGLLARKSSPNGKRYRVMDECAEARLTYGIDLSPLFAIRDHLIALADDCSRDEIRCKALRSVIRDILYNQAADIQPAVRDLAYRSLRRCLSSDQLANLIKKLQDELPQAGAEPSSVTESVTGSDRQNDRHIQKSKKENYESECAAENASSGVCTNDQATNDEERDSDITVSECMALAKNAASFASSGAKDWSDVVRLSDTLAPAVGLARSDVENARDAMGALGSALAILGIVEAFDRIRRPRAYLQALTKRAAKEGIDVVRMFRSLTNCRASTAPTVVIA